MRLLAILPVILWAGAAAASPLLTAKPPCPAPANLPSSASAEYDPAAGGAAPADLGGPPPAVNLDIPLGIPVPSLTNAPPSADLSLSQVPVGKVAIRNGKAENIEVLGQIPQPQQFQAPLDCAPAPSTMP
jgi:hypothetical protein